MGILNNCPSCGKVNSQLLCSCPNCGTYLLTTHLQCGGCGNFLRNGPGTPCTFTSCAKPFFQFNNVAGATAKPEDVDNDHLLVVDTWKCAECGESNESDQFPIRCKICRRYR